MLMSSSPGSALSKDCSTSVIIFYGLNWVFAKLTYAPPPFVNCGLKEGGVKCIGHPVIILF